jgi:tRNA/rRNA methyltransferase
MTRKFPDSGCGQLAVVLVSTRNPLNLGAAARAMSNFGFTDLRVVNSYQVAFREAKSAVGAREVLNSAREYKDVAEAIGDCSLVVGTTAARNRKLEHTVRALKEGARFIRKARRSGRTAVLFGSEKRGLSNHDLSYCHWLLRIPTREDHPSMNLGQAVAICLYELAGGRAATPGSLVTPDPVVTSPIQLRKRPIAVTPPPDATGAELDRLASILVEALDSAAYPKSGRTQEKILRLVRRLNLSEQDTQLLSGMLRQMIWKMRAK